MATPNRIAIRTAKTLTQILEEIDKLAAQIAELRTEIAEMKPKKRGRKPAIEMEQ